MIITDQNFDRADEFRAAQEGGYVDNPKDPGGPTYAGIALRYVVDVRDEAGKLVFDVDGDGDVDAEDIKALKDHQELVRQHYYTNYWLESHCDKLRWPICLVHYDAAVNNGVGAAALILQRALGVEPDRIIGPKTIAAANRPDPTVPALVRRILTERSWLYYQISVSQAIKAARAQADRGARYEAALEKSLYETPFLKGWSKRLFDLQAECLRRI